MHSYSKYFSLWFFAVCFLFAANSPSLAAKIEPLSHVDKEYMALHKERLDNLIRRHTGRQLNQEKQNDIEVLQLIIDRKLIDTSDQHLMQAMGYQLGHVLAREYALNWVVYKDKYGRSRALHRTGSEEYIFPATVLSKKLSLDLAVDVQSVYKAMAKSARGNNPWFD